MKLYIALISVLMLISFQYDSKQEKIEDPKSDDITFSKSDESGSADFISRIKNNIYLDITIKVFSVDSIVVKSTLINNSDEVVEIFKPLLPADTLAGALFTITYKNNRDSIVEFIDTVRRFRYTKNSDFKKPLFRVLPDSAKPDQYIVIQPKQRLEFSLNIARFYNFKSLWLRKIRHFGISYFCWIPEVKNGQHVYEREKYGNRNLLPVYFGMFSQPDKTKRHVKYIRFKIK